MRANAAKNRFLSSHRWIDDRDEVHDPFCDMHLFLSGKITKFLQLVNEETSWSPRMQSELLRYLHADFKERFPMHRLAGPCLKKVFEKVTYYQSWLRSHANLLKPSGSINTDALIRHHLKRPNTHREEHPYMCASRIAYKVSECIATCEGKRPSIENLTRRVWAAYKNTLAQEYETSFDHIEDIDRFIVKTQTELLADDPLLSEKKLRAAITKRALLFAKTPAKFFSDDVTLISSVLLAKSKNFFQAHTNAEKRALKKFVRCQQELAKRKTHDAEVGRRLLALYPLAVKLPFPISEEKLRGAIRYIYALSCGRTLPSCPILDPAIYALLNAQVIALIGRHPLPTEADVTDHLLKLFDAAKNLPKLQPFELESTLWLHLVENLPDTLLNTVIETTLAETYLSSKALNFEQIVLKTVQTLQQTKRIIDEFMFTDCELNGRIRTWTVQGDMIHRWLKFHLPEAADSSTAFPAYAQKQKTISSKCAFYNRKKQAPLDQLKTWHTERLKKLYPELPKREINQKIRALTRKLAPLCP